jgi:hypothetical protein
MPQIETTSGSKITNRSFQSFISNYFRQGLQSLLDQATHWLADIPKTMFAKTPFELEYEDKNFWAAHFASEIESLKAELMEGLTLGDLQNRLIELQGIIGKHTLSPVVYYQGLLELQGFLIANKELTRHADVVTHTLQDFKIALHEQVSLVRECFEGDSQLWLQQLASPNREIYRHIIHALIDYQRFTAPGVYLSLLFQFRQKAIAIAQTALIRNLTRMIFALERRGIQPIEKDQEDQAIENEESNELLRMNEKESATKPAEKKDFLHSVFNTMKSWGEYVLNHPGQAVTLGLAAQAVAAAALESSLATKRSNQDRTLIEDMQQAAQQSQFDKLGQALATGLASTAQVMPDPSIQLPTVQGDAQLRNKRPKRTDNKGGNGAAPSAAGSSEGDFVIVFQQNSTQANSGSLYEGLHDNVYIWTYNNAGASLVNFPVKLNSYTAYTRAEPVVAVLNDGIFATAWQSFNQAPDPGCTSACWDIYANLYDFSASQETTSTEFLVNVNYTIGDQSQPAIASLNNGGFVVAWQSVPQPFDYNSFEYNIYAQRFNATGDRLGTEILVNDFSTLNYFNYQIRPAITSLNSGDFVITWQSSVCATTGCGESSIYVQQFEISGNPLGNGTQTPVDDGYDSENPAIAGLQNGGFVITWQRTTAEGGDFEIYGRQYNATGSPQGGRFQVNDCTYGNQQDPSVAGLNNGGFVVAWGYSQTSDDFSGVYAREFDAFSNPIAGECLIAGSCVSAQMYPVVASLSNGNFVITWQIPNYNFNYTILEPGFSINCSVISCGVNCPTTNITMISSSNTMTSSSNTMTSSSNTMTSSSNTMTSSSNTMTSSSNTMTSSSNTMTSSSNTTNTKIGIGVGVGVGVGTAVAGLLAFGIWKKYYRQKQSQENFTHFERELSQMDIG